MLPRLMVWVARTIRKTSNVPIIVLSAKDTEFDKVIGLEIGADDYVAKPFSNPRNCKHVWALRRSGCGRSSAWKWGRYGNCSGDLHILPDAFLVQRPAKVDLTHREFELLYLPIVGQVMTPWSTLRQCGAMILWWCSDGGCDGSSVAWKNRGHTGASRIYLDPP